MNPLSKVNNHVLGILLIICVVYFTACSSSKDQLKPVAVTNSNAIKKGKNVLFVYNDQARQAASYENIKGNIPRLKAMLSGHFVQHNTNADSLKKKYSTWYVNGGKDSVMLYQLPIGEPNKDGHWMYHYQYMTSLPEEPVYEYFSKMTEINRDSIVATYYEVPDDFEATINKILAKPEVVFRDFNFEGLKLAETGEIIYYERQTPLKYTALSNYRNLQTKNEDYQGGFEADYYEVTPELLEFGKKYFNKDKEHVIKARPEHLIKQAMLAPQYLGR